MTLGTLGWAGGRQKDRKGEGDQKGGCEDRKMRKL